MNTKEKNDKGTVYDDAMIHEQNKLFSERMDNLIKKLMEQL